MCDGSRFATFAILFCDDYRSTHIIILHSFVKKTQKIFLILKH